MNKEKLMKIIIEPCVSEKSTQVQINRQYVFRVCSCATKPLIKQAVKFMFGVDVESVSVCNVKGKSRSFRNIAGRRKDWKKAYVTLKEGQAINLGAA